ncbi:MAG: glycosyltransferase family 4 protein [Ignavibacteriaceae bacterium]|jgi:glycosyltransferase involved in cell wall biosynthesis
MKLLLLNYEYPPLGGGAGRAMQSIAEQLALMGYNVNIITSHTSFSYEDIIEKGYKVHFVPSLRKGIHDCGLRGALTYLFFAYFKLIKLLRSNDYDVVHYFFSLPTAFLSILPGKHRKLPYIVSLRGSDVPNYDIYNSRLELLHKIYLPVTKYIWRKAKSVIAVTNSLKQTALLSNPKQTIKVIPNGIDTNIFSPNSDNPRDDEKFRLITVSRLIKRKGIQDVLKALSEIDDNCTRLNIIGEGNYENELKNMSTKLGLNDRVKFIGFCPRNDIPSYFWQSDAFILLSLAEAFGNVIAEAMACGLPIIGANEGGIPDLVAQENGILVQPGNIEEIKSAIIFMKNNKEIRIKMGKANVEKILRNYSWEKIACAYKKIYLKSLNGSYRKN